MTQPIKTLIRREFWEHRALWIAPLAVAGLLLIGALIGKVTFDVGLAPTPEQRKALFGLALWVSALPELLTLVIIVWIYAGDCLYTERKDRSILFWKSMPVSDRQTVLAKLLVAVLVVPLLVYAVSVLTSLLSFTIYWVRALEGQRVGVFWDTTTWLRMQGLSFEVLVAGVLWLAPITAYLLMVSAWARRSVWLWVLLPPFIAVLLERIALGTHHLQDIVRYRLWGVFQQPGLPAFGQAVSDPTGFALNQTFTSVDPGPIFSNMDLWLGLLVAAVFVLITIRIRQYRDDT